MHSPYKLGEQSSETQIASWDAASGGRVGDTAGSGGWGGDQALDGRWWIPSSWGSDALCFSEWPASSITPLLVHHRPRTVKEQRAEVEQTLKVMNRRRTKSF